MRKRIIMAAAVCFFGLLECLCAGKVESKVALIGIQVTGLQKQTLTDMEEMAEQTAEQTAEQISEHTTDKSETDMGAIVAVTDSDEMQSVTENAKVEETEEEIISDANEVIMEEEESEYANLAIADVTDYVNVRTEPNTDSEIIGKIYDGAIAQILATTGEADDWFQIVSGNVEGYIKAEFFLYGDAAAEVIEEYVTRYAKVHADRLNVRKEPSTESDRIGYIDSGEKVKVLEDCGEWIRVQYTAQKEGYVSAEYVTLQEEFVYAKTLEEEQAEIAARQALEARQNVAEGAAPEMLTNITFPATAYTSNEELRKGIIEYALQFVGDKYVHGGTSLATGTDCSGFTCFIYADFGYSISRTPGGQYSGAGRSIDYSEIQPGDIICYSSNGGKSCTHVALYIGDGQIVHAANSRKGVITSAADYSPIIGIKNVID